jgi:hypothetical protein
MALLPPVRIPALAHPVCVCLVDALADSPVVWSHRMLDLSENRIVSVAGVSWPSSLEYVSTLTCSEGQSTKSHNIPDASVLFDTFLSFLMCLALFTPGSCT